MKIAPPPMAAPTPRPPPPGGGAPSRRRPKPKRPAIFCCSFLRISSRSGGPSLFFFPHWGSAGGIGEGTGGVRKSAAQAIDARAGGRTYLDIQYLTTRIA